MDMVTIARGLADEFRANAAELDRTGEFPKAHYERMRDTGYLRGPVPQDLGGLGAGLAETAAAQRQLARGCASTALAVNMHLFQVGAAADGHRAGKPVATMLKRVADEGIVLASTGAEAIVAGAFTTQTTAKRDGDDHYVISGRKFFCSQAPGMDVVRVNAVDVETGEICVFAVPATVEGVRVEETWDTTGMRATASHDVVLDDVRVPASAVGARLPADAPIDDPAFTNVIHWFLACVSGVYVGVAEEARDLALATSGRSGNSRFRDDALTDVMVGQLETSLLTATAVHESALARLDGMAGTTEALTLAASCKQFVTEAAIATVDIAVALSGGSAYFRRSPLERLARDVRAARFHPPAALVSYQIVGARTRRRVEPEFAG